MGSLVAVPWLGRCLATTQAPVIQMKGKPLYARAYMQQWGSIVRQWTRRDLMDGLKTRTRLEPPQNVIIIVIANWSLIRLYTYTNDANDDDHRSSILPHLHPAASPWCVQPPELLQQQQGLESRCSLSLSIFSSSFNRTLLVIILFHRKRWIFNNDNASIMCNESTKRAWDAVVCFLILQDN